MKYDALFTPFKIGNMEVKNRFVMAPMGTNSSHIDGCIANDEIDYFEARAKGGVGLIIMGCQFLNPDLAQGSLEGVLQNILRQYLKHLPQLFLKSQLIPYFHPRFYPLQIDDLKQF